jgi:hypothetical protein
VERRALGSSGPVVPVVGVGTWRTFDVQGTEAERDAAQRVDEALEAGANLFDSSPMYGRAERALGRALEGRRDQALRRSDRRSGRWGTSAGSSTSTRSTTWLRGSGGSISSNTSGTTDGLRPSGPPTTARRLSTSWRR